MASLIVGFTDKGLLQKITPEQSTAYLSQELGLTLQKKQEASIMAAISDPNTYVAKRGKAIDAAVTIAGNYYSDYYTSLITSGVPMETARAMSIGLAKSLADAEMAKWNLENPGYEQAFRAADVNTGFRAEKSNLLTSGNTQSGLTKAQKRAIKDKAVTKYKARKRSKAAGAKTV